jgi:hypothetical protein
MLKGFDTVGSGVWSIGYGDHLGSGLPGIEGPVFPPLIEVESTTLARFPSSGGSEMPSVISHLYAAGISSTV